MGMLIKMNDSSYGIDENGNWKRTTHKSGLTLTDTGYRNIGFAKRRRGGYYSKCGECGEKCCQSIGNSYDRVCIECSPEWLKNSIEEMDRIKARLEKQQKHIADNIGKMNKYEKKTLEKWERMDILDKLESEE